jgi:putative ABC transport system substrate-binding protein
MRRRNFIAGLVSTTAAWPLAARAQRSAMPVVGWLGGGTAASQGAWVDAFVRRLGELGWIEGRTVVIEYRWGEGRAERYAEIAAEFVRLKPDVIVAAGTEASIAAKQATSSIPIVFSTAGDPIGSGLVASLARPGGNVTGLSNLATDTAAKRIEILREVFPGLSRLAVMANADYSGGVTERREIDAAARTFGLEIIPLPIRRRGNRVSVRGAQEPRRGALYYWRPADEPTASAHQHPCPCRTSADDVPTAAVSRSRSDLLWPELPRHEPTRCRLCRQDSARS